MSYDDVIERSLGIFGAYLTPGSFLGNRTMQCCTANAARGLHYGWEAITHCEGDEAQVNLLLNRAAPWVDIDSYLPFEGRAVIRNKTCRRIAVRIPAWVNRAKLNCTVSGEPRGLSVVGGYQIFDGLEPGDEIELRFPVPETIIERTAHAGTEAETVYTITMRGSIGAPQPPVANLPPGR